MAYVIASACIDVKDGACQDVCPVECIYEGGRMMYIQPDECINCGICLSVCPVEAIFDEDNLPDTEIAYRGINAEFFGPAVTAWGSPGGAGPAHATNTDHPVVAAYSAQGKSGH
jgi:NAD-dependent dihydropyrimidine dehydrogenase PreA subunit